MAKVFNRTDMSRIMYEAGDWSENASLSGALDVQARRFILIVLSMIGLLFAVLVVWGLKDRDHFGQISLFDDRGWYLNYAYLRVREMQDRDILYHNVGSSIEHLREADIVFLGNSVVQFALDWRLVEAFEKKHGVRVYDMSFPGLASGEFLRSLLAKWNVKDKLWVVNADDYPDSFFAPETTDRFGVGRNSIPQVREENRLTGYLNVASRNLSMGIDLMVSHWLPTVFRTAYATAPAGCAGASSYPMVWRNIENGTSYLEKYWGYNCTDAADVKLIRDQKCPASQDEIALAGRYLSALGGTAVLTQIPYERWCPQRVREIASALSVESVIVPSSRYAVWDGRHMAKKGSENFTRDFMAGLEQSEAFRQLLSRQALNASQ